MSGVPAWTDPRDAELVRLYAAGLAWAEIAQLVGTTASACQTRLYGLRKSGIVKAQGRCGGWRKPTGTKRACLRCHRAFDSEGPHNRLCGPCKLLPIWGGISEVAVMVPR